MANESSPTERKKPAGPAVYRAPDGRAFDQLSDAEKEAVVNGPTIGFVWVAIAFGAWLMYVLFLAVQAGRYF